jgi:hypothetical protein
MQTVLFGVKAAAELCFGYATAERMRNPLVGGVDMGGGKTHDENMLSGVDLNLSYLEKLSAPELRDLAIAFGIDIPHNMERPFIIEEILDNAPCLTFFQRGKIASRSMETEFTDFENIPPVPEPVELPKQYNITRINAIVRDPLWVFVFWEIRDADRKIYEKQHGFRGYFLRVSLDQCKKGNEAGTVFTIPVSANDTERYIHFPSVEHCKELCGSDVVSPFNVALCYSHTGGEAVLAVTLPFRLPGMLEISERIVPARDKDTLLRLSGIDDLPVLRNL